MMMPKGIYLYRFTVEGGDYRRDYDVDKSEFLTVDSPEPTSEFLTDDGTTALHRLWYNLTSTDQPDPGRDASYGQVWVFDQETTLTATVGLAGLAPDPNPLSPGPHVVQVPMPSPIEPSHVHLLVCPVDSDADHDKAHRQRWALQHNQRGGKGATITFEYGGGNLLQDGFSLSGDQHAMHLGQKYWTPGMRSMGYHNLVGNFWTTFYNRYVWPINFLTHVGILAYFLGLAPALPDYDWCEANDASTRIAQALQWTDQGGNKPLQTLLLLGHGEEDGSILCVAGANAYAATVGDHTRTNIVSNRSQAELAAHPELTAGPGGTPTQDCLFLSDLQGGDPNSRPLANIRLAVVMGWDLGLATSVPNGITTLRDELLALGVQCVVAVGDHAQDDALFGDWFDGYNGNAGFLATLQSGHTIREAAASGDAAMGAVPSNNGAAHPHTEGGNSDAKL